MKILVIVTLSILITGLLANVWMLHGARRPLTPSRVGLAALVCIVGSGALATGATRLLLGSRCDAAATCDYASLLEGGMTWPATWLTFYAAAYLLAAGLVAQLPHRF